MSTRLILLPAAADAPLHWLLPRSDGHHAQGIVDTTLPDAARTVLVVPGVDVRLFWLELPAGNPAQVLAAARLALADHVAEDPATLHLAFGAAIAGTPRLVAAVERSRMQDWLARASSLGITPDLVVPDCLLLPEPDDGSTHAVAWDGRWLLRGTRLAASVEPDLAPLLTGLPDLKPDGDALHSFATTPPPLDLLQYAFAPQRATAAAPRWRRLLWLAAAVLLSPLLLVLAEALRYEIGARLLHGRATDAVAAQLGGTVDGDPLQALESARQQGGSALARSGDALARALAASPGLRLERFEYNEGAPVRIHVQHPDADALATLQRQLQAAGMRPAVVGGSSPDDDGMQRTTLTLEDGA